MIEIRCNGKIYVLDKYDAGELLEKIQATAVNTKDDPMEAPVPGIRLNQDQPIYVREGVMYTHNIASDILEAFEDLLEEKNITVPCADPDEQHDRTQDDNSARLYGMEYSDLLEKIELTLCNMLDTAVKTGYVGYIQDQFSGPA